MPPSPDWLSWEFWAKDTQGLYHLALIIAGVIGAVLLAWRTWAVNQSARAAGVQAKTAADRHTEQTKADRERRITESFAKAIEQLSSDKLETRLGGIYTLERIARESEREYWPIMEVLTAYVREHAPWPPPQQLGQPCVELQVSDREIDHDREEPIASGGSVESMWLAGSDYLAVLPRGGKRPREDISTETRPPADVQAILTVVGRRDEQRRKQDKAEGRSLVLHKTDLRGVDLSGAHFEGANFENAHLEDADLWKAYLDDAHLEEAHLQGAWLFGTHLQHAHLEKAHLQGATLWKTDFFEAKLEGAHLEGAKLWGASLVAADLEGAHFDKRTELNQADLEAANLEGAQNLTQEQLETAHGTNYTTLPQGLRRPTHWPLTHWPLEPDSQEQ